MPGQAPDALLVGERQRLDQAGAPDHDQAVRSGDVDALAEAGAHRDQQPEQEHRHGERADREHRADLLARQVGEEQRQELHERHQPRAACLLRGLDQHALLEVQQRARALGRARVVGHHQDRLAVLRDEQAQQVQDLVRALAVEVAGRLVAQQERRVGHDRARDRHALLLPARELAREVVHALREPHEAQRGLHVRRAAPPPRSGRQQQRQLDVAIGREHGDQVVGLEHEAHVARAPGGELAARHRRDLVAGHADGAGARHVQAAEQVEQRRLARSARAHEGDELARADVEVQPLEDADLLAAAHVALAEAARPDQGLPVPVAVDSHHECAPGPARRRAASVPYYGRGIASVPSRR